MLRLRSEDRSHLWGALLGFVLTIPVAALFIGTEASGMAWAAVPVAGVAGWWLARAPLGANQSQRILLAGLAFGGVVASGAVLLFVVATMAAALAPGSTVARPESPVGYQIVFVLTVVVMTPVVAVPASVIGLAWAALLRRISAREQV